MKLAALLLAASVCFAQEIVIRPQLHVGDTFELLTTRGRSDSSNPQVNGTSRTPVTVRVLEANAQGFVLDWTQGETDLSAFPGAQSDPIAAAALRAGKDLHLEAILSPEGKFQSLRNAAQVTAAFGTFVDDLLKMVMDEVPAGQRTQVEAGVRQLLSPAPLIAAATQDIQLYFNLHGAALKPGEEVEAGIRQPGLDGSTVQAYFRVKMDNANPQTASLSTVTRYDPAGLRAMTLRLIERSGQQIPASQLSQIPTVEMRDTASYVYDREFGLMRSVKGERVVASGTMRRVDTFEIQLVKVPAR